VSKGFAIAIDGPVGVGKSTIARKVSENLGITYVDTGAMYRAVALYNIQNGNDLTNAEEIRLSLDNINISLSIIEGQQKVYLNGLDITEDIRTQEVSQGASIVASFEFVREKLVKEQQEMAKSKDVVMDGRDIGSNVLPWAQVKIYLDADLDIRTHRRMLDLQAKNQTVDFDEIRKDTISRDERDINRKNNPLICTEDAIRIDTGLMSINEVSDTIVDLAREGFTLTLPQGDKSP